MIAILNMRRSDHACNDNDDNDDNEEEDKNGPWFCVMMVYAMISVMIRMMRERVQDCKTVLADMPPLSAWLPFAWRRRKGGRDGEDDDEKTVLIYMSHNFPPGCLLFGQEAALNE